MARTSYSQKVADKNMQLSFDKDEIDLMHKKFFNVLWRKKQTNVKKG